MFSSLCLFLSISICSDVFFKRALELRRSPLRFNHQLTALKTFLPALFGQVGYVSNHFLDSSFQAVKVYFEVRTFHANLHDIPKLPSLASFFGADLQSVFLVNLRELKN
ncbi:hypothetical protein GEMRC1_004975 [Eukaryota sp. GEM-RC1]